VTRLFALKLALREGRSGFRHLGVHTASIALGVAALVAIHSFRADVTASVQEEARSILGADLRLSASRPLPDSVQSVVDSLVDGGATAVRVVDLPTMVLAERSNRARLLQLRSVQAAFPFYGQVTTEPVGAWERLGEAGTVLMDAPALLQLDAEIGDTVSLGIQRYRIGGTVDGLPTDLGLQAAVGPRVYLPLDQLEATGLLAFGSLARHQVFVRLDRPEQADAVDDAYRPLWRATSVQSTTATEQADNLSEATQLLARFLALVGLAALLLGGIGVASAAHAYVKGKLTSVAVLRCLGATQASVFLAYLLQAAALGVIGSLLGVLLGVVTQRTLPRMVGSLLPVEIATRIQWPAIGVGLGVGIWVSVVFALLPLLTVLDVPPLRALRVSVETVRPRRWIRAAAVAALVASIALLSVFEAPTPGIGLAFAAGLAVTLGLLRLAAWGLVSATRRWFPSQAAYPVRQGVANLFRPGNQTGAVTLALGFAAFVIGTMLVLRASLEQALTLDSAQEQPNLVLFDIQTQQRDSVLAQLGPVVVGEPQVLPIVAAEISALNGVSVADLLADTTDGGPERWALRRTYRNTHRADLTKGEEIVAGSWWEEERLPADSAVRISVEQDLAESLGLALGDHIRWRIQGVELESRIASLRTVDWDQFAPNFFVVFEPGSVDDAPQTTIAFVRVPDPEARAKLQTDLVRGFPNVSSLDVGRVQEVLDRVLGRVTGAIRFLATIAVLGGLLVLMGALSTSRFQRLREGAVLKTLGARRAQILAILLVEYATLGALAGLAGLSLSLVGAWALSAGLFEVAVVIPWPWLAAAWGIIVVATTMVGLAGSRPVLSRSPLASLRDPAVV